MKHICLAILACAGLGGCASTSVESASQSASQWQLIDDFEGPNALNDWTTVDPQNETEPFVPNPQITEVRSEEGTGNKYLHRQAAAHGVVGNRKALAWTELPRPLAVGETATFFTRINLKQWSTNHVFGLTNQNGESITELGYDAFEPMIRITDRVEGNGKKLTGALMVLIGYKNYVPINNRATAGPADPLIPGEWYDLWYVVNNATKADGGQTYDFYVKGGEFAEQTKVFSGAVFRFGREQPLIHFVATSNTGPARAPYGNGAVRYDDIYMASGEMLSDPTQ